MHSKSVCFCEPEEKHFFLGIWIGPLPLNSTKNKNKNKPTNNKLVRVGIKPDPVCHGNHPPVTSRLLLLPPSRKSLGARLFGQSSFLCAFSPSTFLFWWYLLWQPIKLIVFLDFPQQSSCFECRLDKIRCHSRRYSHGHFFLGFNPIRRCSITNVETQDVYFVVQSLSSGATAQVTYRIVLPPSWKLVSASDWVGSFKDMINCFVESSYITFGLGVSGDKTTVIDNNFKFPTGSVLKYPFDSTRQWLARIALMSHQQTPRKLLPLHIHL